MPTTAPATTTRQAPPCSPPRRSSRSFEARHQAGTTVPTDAPLLEDKVAFVGVDAGSTTVKAVAGKLPRGDHLLPVFCPTPQPGAPGAPVPFRALREISRHPDQVRRLHRLRGGDHQKRLRLGFWGWWRPSPTLPPPGSSSPTVDFIIDIGGQDIKCFQIKNGAIDNIFLNEACSSGCGQLFCRPSPGPWAIRWPTSARLGLFADSPVDLGSRCTVFMNSSVKQAQKDGASIENISAGLSMSVVKNALYKVIRVVDAKSLGQHVVVQGGTFLNDAVLRAFEKEIGQNVTRPSVSGLMGAYGAALYAKEKGPGGELYSGPPGADELPARGQGHHLQRLREPLPPDGEHLPGRGPVHRRQPLRQAPAQGGQDHPVQPLRLQAPAAGLLQALPRSPGDHRHPHGAEHVRALPLLAHLLPHPGLRGVPLSRVRPEAVLPGPAHHPPQTRCATPPSSSTATSRPCWTSGPTPSSTPA